MGVRSNLAKCGAILEGEHFFVLKSGRVALKYVNIDPVFTFPDMVAELGKELIKPFVENCEAIVGPAVGGIPLIFAAERYMHAKAQSDSMDTDAHERVSIRTAWADKKSNGTLELERMGFKKAIAGKKVVVLEDIVTTGDSVAVTAALVREAGGEVIGISCIWNRGGATAEALGVPIFNALITESIMSWSSGEHPKWGEWPIVGDIGHPEWYPNYPGNLINVLS